METESTWAKVSPLQLRRPCIDYIHTTYSRERSLVWSNGKGSDIFARQWCLGSLPGCLCRWHHCHCSKWQEASWNEKRVWSQFDIKDMWNFITYLPRSVCRIKPMAVLGLDNLHTLTKFGTRMPKSALLQLTQATSLWKPLKHMSYSIHSQLIVCRIYLSVATRPKLLSIYWIAESHEVPEMHEWP